MNHLLPRPRCGAALLLAAATAAGCATTKPTPSPQEEYRQAVAEAQKGHYVEAQRLFEEVRDADTPVRLELLAEVGVADALYKGGKFEEAAQAYNKLLTVHSGDPIADYLNYQLAMCFYRRIDTVDRDQGLTRRARSQFMALITRYPESDLVPAAREKLQACNDYLARRELYVGRFYFKRSNYEAAKRRFIRGLGRYGKVEVEPKLLHDLSLAEDGLGETDLADQAAKRLRHDFPAAAATASLADDRAEARARREGNTSDGPLHRIGRWWSDRHPKVEGKATEGATTEAVPPAATAPAPAESPAKAAPAPAAPPPPTTTGDGGAAAEPSHPTRVSALDPEAPWPGSTVATVSTDAAVTANNATPPPEAPSRWHHLLSWLHRNGAAPTEPAIVPKATPVSTPASGLIIRHIPPVTPSSSPITQIPTTVETELPSQPSIAVVSAPPVAALPAAPAGPPLAAKTKAKTKGGDLVVEAFPAVEEDAAASRPAPATPRKGSLADRVDETLGQESSALAAAPPAAAQPVETTQLPTAAPPTPQPLVASGEALRHDRPRPLPQPAFTRPSPPLPDESLPATMTGGDQAVEWHTMTPPPVVEVEEVAPAAVAEPPVAAAPSPPAGESDGHGAFWSGVRERFTGTTAAAE